MSVVVCTDLSGKEPHRQVGVGREVTSGSLGGVMFSTLATRCGFDSHSGAIFPAFITPPTVVMSVLGLKTNYVK